MTKGNSHNGPALIKDSLADIAKHVPSVDGVSPGTSSLIIAIEQIQTEQITKAGAGALVDVLKGMSVGYLGERDGHICRIAELEGAVARTMAERDTALARLEDLRDINILHTLILAVGTAMLGCFASYDSAGKGEEYACLLYIGAGCVVIWIGFLMHRFVKMNGRGKPVTATVVSGDTAQ